MGFATISLTAGYPPSISIIKQHPTSFQLQRINTDYATLISLYEYAVSYNLHHLFASLQHISIRDTLGCQSNHHLLTLKQLIANTTTINSIEIQHSESPSLDVELYNIPHLQHLSYKEHILQRSPRQQSRYITFPTTLKSLSIPSSSFYHTNGNSNKEIYALPELTTFRVFDYPPFPALPLSCSRIPDYIVNLTVVMSPSYQLIDNRIMVKWLQQQESLKYLKLIGIQLTKSLCQLLHLELNTLTLGIGKYVFGEDNTDGYQMFGQGVRSAFLYYGVTTHVVIQDARWREEIIRENEHLRGVYIHTLNGSAKSKMEITLDRDNEWLDNNKKRLESLIIPKWVLEKILFTSSTTLADLTIYARVSTALFKYIRDIFVIKNIDSKYDKANLFSRYSILSIHNIQYAVFTFSHIIEFDRYKGNHSQLVFPNIKSLVIDFERNDGVPMEIVLPMPNLTSIQVIHRGNTIYNSDDSVELASFNARLFKFHYIRLVDDSNQCVILRYKSKKL